MYTGLQTHQTKNKVHAGPAAGASKNQRLTLTVALQPYAYMTASVGMRGRKGQESRIACEWMDAQVVGKEYDEVLLYGGYAKNRPWTLFEYEGLEVVGDDDDEYVVAE